MKLITNKVSKYKGKQYYAYRVAIPPNTVRALGWSNCEELEFSVRDNAITIRPKEVEGCFDG